MRWGPSRWRIYGLLIHLLKNKELPWWRGSLLHRPIVKTKGEHQETLVN